MNQARSTADGSAAIGSAVPAQSRSKDFSLRGPEVLRHGRAGDPDQTGDLSQRRLRGTRVVTEMKRELEEIPLPLCQRSERLPSLQGRILHRPNPVRGLHVIEESAQGGGPLLRRQQG